MTRHSSDDGYVTLAVLVISGLLAALVSSLFTVARPAIDLARIGADAAMVEGMLDGGLTAAGFLLYDAKRDMPKVDGTVLQYGMGRVELEVLDESGRVDLNGSSPELLAGLFRAAGGRSLEPDAFAARIVDWRDTDSDTGVGGAERNDYAAAGAAVTPRNAPFGSIDELRFLLGLSRDDLERLRPYLTIFNVEGTIDPFSADAVVLRAIPGVRRADVARFMKARAEEPDSRDPELLALLGDSGGLFREDASGVYRVRLDARLSTGAREIAEAVIAAPAEEGGAFGVVAWSTRPASPAAQ
jgi:general secretion pathway protein K